MPLDPQTEVHRPEVLIVGDIKKIAITKMDHVGDCFATIPAMNRLRERFPDAHYTVFCGTWGVPIFKHIGFKDIIPITFFHENAMTGGIIGLSKEDKEKLNAEEYDLAIDFRAFPESHAVLAQIRSKHYASVTPITNIKTIHTHEAVPRNSIHSRIMQALVGYLPIVKAPRPYDPDKPICLAYNASNKFKLWRPSRMVQLGQELLTEGHKVVVGYSPNQPVETTEMAEKLNVPLIRGSDVQEYVDKVLDQCSIYLGFDTGPSHATAAAGVPTVTIMGNLVDVEMWMPLGARVITLHKNMGRPPCGNARNCPCNYGCTDIPVADVKWAIYESMK